MSKELRKLSLIAAMIVFFVLLSQLNLHQKTTHIVIWEGKEYVVDASAGTITDESKNTFIFDISRSSQGIWVKIRYPNGAVFEWLKPRESEDISANLPDVIFPAGQDLIGILEATVLSEKLFKR